MTCAHVVNVALMKVNGVESADVSLNRALAVVKLKPGNKVVLAQLIKLIQEKGYTIKTAAISVRGVPLQARNRWMLQVSGSEELLELVPGTPGSGPYEEISRRGKQTVTVQGSVTPPKNLKNTLPLIVTEVK